MGRVREVSGDGALVGTVGHRGALGRSDDTADIVAGRNLGRILAEDGHGALVDAVFRGRVDEDADDAGRHDEHVEVGDARVLDGYRTGMGQGDGSGVLVALEGAALLDGDDAADDRARQGAGAGHGYGRLVGDVGDGTGGVAGERGELVLGSRVIRIEALREGALDGEVLDGTGERSEERGGGGDILQGVARSVEGTGEGGGPGDLDILEVDVLGEGDGRRLRRQFGRDIDPGCEIIRIVQAQRVGEGHGFGRGAVRIGELRSFVAARAEGLDAELVGLLGPQAVDQEVGLADGFGDSLPFFILRTFHLDPVGGRVLDGVPGDVGRLRSHRGTGDDRLAEVDLRQGLSGGLVGIAGTVGGECPDAEAVGDAVLESFDRAAGFFRAVAGRPGRSVGLLVFDDIPFGAVHGIPADGRVVVEDIDLDIGRGIELRLVGLVAAVLERGRVEHDEYRVVVGARVLGTGGQGLDVAGGNAGDHAVEDDFTPDGDRSLRSADTDEGRGAVVVTEDHAGVLIGGLAVADDAGDIAAGEVPAGVGLVAGVAEDTADALRGDFGSDVSEGLAVDDLEAVGGEAGDTACHASRDTAFQADFTIVDTAVDDAGTAVDTAHAALAETLQGDAAVVGAVERAVGTGCVFLARPAADAADGGVGLGRVGVDGHIAVVRAVPVVGLVLGRREVITAADTADADDVLMSAAREGGFLGALDRDVDGAVVDAVLDQAVRVRDDAGELVAVEVGGRIFLDGGEGVVDGTEVRAALDVEVVPVAVGGDTGDSRGAVGGVHDLALAVGILGGDGDAAFVRDTFKEVLDVTDDAGDGNTLDDGARELDIAFVDGLTLDGTSGGSGDAAHHDGGGKFIRGGSRNRTFVHDILDGALILGGDAGNEHLAAGFGEEADVNLGGYVGNGTLVLQDEGGEAFAVPLDGALDGDVPDGTAGFDLIEERSGNPLDGVAAAVEDAEDGFIHRGVGLTGKVEVAGDGKDFAFIDFHDAAFQPGDELVGRFHFLREGTGLAGGNGLDVAVFGIAGEGERLTPDVKRRLGREVHDLEDGLFPGRDRGNGPVGFGGFLVFDLVSDGVGQVVPLDDEARRSAGHLIDVGIFDAFRDDAAAYLEVGGVAFRRGEPGPVGIDGHRIIRPDADIVLLAEGLSVHLGGELGRDVAVFIRFDLDGLAERGVVHVRLDELSSGRVRVFHELDGERSRARFDGFGTGPFECNSLAAVGHPFVGELGNPRFVAVDAGMDALLDASREHQQGRGKHGRQYSE